MNPARGYYALVQYCPDSSRAEGANVGVILFAPELRFIDVRSSRSSDRVRRFFTGRQLDLPRIDAAKQALESRIRLYRDDFKTVKDLEQFAATRANELRIIAPRPIVVTEPERQLVELFDELVGDRARKEPTRRVIRDLEEAFRRPQLEPRMQFNVRLEVPIVGRELVAPYAYTNGRMNLIVPRRFNSEVTAMDSAMRLAVEGDLLHNRLNKNLIVIGDLAPTLESILDLRFEQLFGDFQTRYVPRARIPEFVQEVDAQAH
jgi:hypothetical protein